mmetsp:Transcript_24473/g.74691  ORF Transcript_24473/g.74691 Transcript_24473/m.74691 type:complete len:82 (+) Transcript_24473:499-744(+)
MLASALSHPSYHTVVGREEQPCHLTSVLACPFHTSYYPYQGMLDFNPTYYLFLRCFSSHVRFIWATSDCIALARSVCPIAS